MFAYTKKYLLIRKGSTCIQGEEEKMPNCKPAVTIGGMFFTLGKKIGG